MLHVDQSSPTLTRGRRAVLLLCILVYASLMWVWGVGRKDIHGTMEASRALVARNMMNTGDYVIPRRGVEIYLAKPPLFCWAVTITSRLGGRVTETSVRVVSALCAMAILLLLYFAVRTRFGDIPALLTAAVGATTPLVFDGATDGQVDMMLAMGVTIAILGAFNMLEASGRPWIHAIVSGTGLAIGFLSKGPVVLMFFVPTILLYLGFRHGERLGTDPKRYAPYLATVALCIWAASAGSDVVGDWAAILYAVPVVMIGYFAFRKRSENRRTVEWLICLASALLLSAPWPILAAFRVSLATLLETLKEQLWRCGVTDVGRSNYGPIWLYLERFPAATLPYSLLAPLAFLPWYGSGASQEQKRFLLMARCWLIGSIVLFSVAGSARKVRYVLPAFPPLAILSANVIARSIAGDLREGTLRYVGAVNRFLVYLLLLAPIALVGLWVHASLGWTIWAVAVAFLSVTGAAFGVYLHRVRRSRWAAFLALPIIMLAGKIYLHFGAYQIENREDSSRPACEELRSRIPPGEPLWLCDTSSEATSFYLDARPWESIQSDPIELAKRPRLYLCMDKKARKSFERPMGFRMKELTSAVTPDGRFVLMELTRQDKAPPH